VGQSDKRADKKQTGKSGEGRGGAVGFVGITQNVFRKKIQVASIIRLGLSFCHLVVTDNRLLLTQIKKHGNLRVIHTKFNKYENARRKTKYT
jgi:hypothetical protein